MGEHLDNKLPFILALFLPLLLVLCVFVVSFFFDKGNKNTLFNLSAILGFVAISIICFRTIYDQNMIIWAHHEMNYYYFENHLLPMKIFYYFIFIGNVLLIYQDKKERG